METKPSGICLCVVDCHKEKSGLKKGLVRWLIVDRFSWVLWYCTNVICAQTPASQNTGFKFMSQQKGWLFNIIKFWEGSEKVTPLSLLCQEISLQCYLSSLLFLLGDAIFFHRLDGFEFSRCVNLTGTVGCYNICSSLSVCCSFSDNPIAELALASLIMELDPGQKSRASS